MLLVRRDVIMFCIAFVHAPYFVRKVSAILPNATDGFLTFRPLVHEGMKGFGTWRSKDT
jgi:hypothetical protein